MNAHIPNICVVTVTTLLEIVAIPRHIKAWKKLSHWLKCLERTEPCAFNMLFSFESLSPSRAAAISVSMCHFELNPRCADDRRHFKDVDIGTLTLLFLCYVWCMIECARSCMLNKLGIVRIGKQWQISSRNSVLGTHFYFSFHYDFCCKFSLTSWCAQQCTQDII